MFSTFSGHLISSTSSLDYSRIHLSLWSSFWGSV
jgi:hypothetical protein